MWFLGSELFLVWLLMYQFCCFLVGLYTNIRHITGVLHTNLIIGLPLAFCLLLRPFDYIAYLSNFQLKFDSIESFFLGLVLLFFWLCYFFISYYIEQDKMVSDEYILLMLLSVLGMLLLLLANDGLLFFLGLELQSLAIYILAAYKQWSYFSNEAGLKYFILGSFSSGIILFGFSLIYGNIATINFEEFAYFFSMLGVDSFSYSLFMGLFLVLVGILFKLGVAPFHVWLPDVYSGVPTGFLLFFAIIPKIALLGFLFKFTLFVLSVGVVEWSYLLLVCGVLSIIIGVLGAMYQESIQRLLAYSAVAQSGYFSVLLSLGTVESLVGYVLYLIVYAMIMLTIVGVIIVVRDWGVQRNIKQLLISYSGLYGENKALVVVLSLALFSLSGIPPLAGFFGKMYLFYGFLTGQAYLLALILILLSAGGVIYYIKIIRIMLLHGREIFSFSVIVPEVLAAVLAYTTIVGVCFIFITGPVVGFIYNFVVNLLI